MKAMIAIMGHGDWKAQLAFDRHLAYWRAHHLPMIAMCPEDSLLRTGMLTLKIGKRSHHSAEANGRFRKLLTALLEWECDHYIIFEYDSLCIVPQLPEPCFVEPGIWGNRFEDNDGRFVSKRFIHPPLIIDRGSMAALVKAAKEVPDSAEGGFWDRWIALVANMAVVPLNGYGSLGFSKNTIESYDLATANQAARKGAILFHGIKSVEALNAVTQPLREMALA